MLSFDSTVPVPVKDPVSVLAQCRHTNLMFRHSLYIMYIMYREEVLQQDMPGGARTPQKAPQGSGRGPDPAWMVSAETQTCAPSQTPTWADEQFSFLELLPSQSSDTDDSDKTSQQAAWSKV